jgi:hypothetical protein
MPRTATPSAQPHALDAEQTLLGALLLDGERFVDVSPLLSAPDFYDPLHQTIYAAVEKLYEARSPVDAVTVADALRNDEALTARGGLPFLISLVANVPTSSHATRYAEIVRDAALRRKLRAIGETIAAVAVDDTFTATEALERSEQHLVGLAKRGSQNLPQHIADIGSDSYERYTQLYEATDKSQLFGIRTGFADLDHLLTGLQPGSRRVQELQRLEGLYLLWCQSAGRGDLQLAARRPGRRLQGRLHRVVRGHGDHLYPARRAKPGGSLTPLSVSGTYNKVPSAQSSGNMDAYSSFLAFRARRAHATGKQ